MEYLHALLLIVGGILAMSALIISKKPDAKQLIDKLVPFQAMIGVALLAVGLVQLLRFGPINMFRLIGPMPILGLTVIAAVFGAIILGFFFGMPMIAKWIPGDSPAEQKAMDLTKKIAGVQVIIGVICAIAGVALLLLTLGVIKAW